MASQIDNQVTIISTLPVERWGEYRALRLRALQTAPQAFGQSYSEVVGYPDARWKQRLIDAAEKKSWLVFAERSGGLIGMSGAYQWPEDREANRAMIIAVFVDEAARGHGIGQKLVDEVLVQLSAAGLTGAILAVNPEQVAAVRLYERMGFQRTGAEINMMGNGEECEEIVMERRLP